MLLTMPWGVAVPSLVDLVNHRLDIDQGRRAVGLIRRDLFTTTADVHASAIIWRIMKVSALTWLFAAKASCQPG